MNSNSPPGESEAVWPTTLEVRQKYWSWFSNTGRGFSINRNDGSVLFVVSTTSMGKHRILQDHLGQPLFDLERNFTSNRGAFVATRMGDEVLRVKYNWVHRKIKMEATLSVEAWSVVGKRIVIEANDTSGSSFSATVGSEVVMDVRCTNVSKGPFGSLKVTPPEWTVKAGSGIDLALVSCKGQSSTFSTAEIDV
jgi:uncharacterized protein YxjI